MVVTQKISIIASLKNLVSKPAQSINKSVGNMVKRYKKVSSMASQAGSTVSQMGNALQEQNLSVVDGNRLYDHTNHQFASMDKNMGTLTKSSKKFGSIFGALKNEFGRFRMEGLSFLFLGMQIQRTFTRIARSATSAFTDIMESNNMMGTAIQRLGVHFKFLKFTIGSALNTALKPLLPQIINIINMITEWIQKNPEWTAGLVLGGIAAGALLFTFGQLYLVLSSVWSFLSTLVGTLKILYDVAIGTKAIGLSSTFLAWAGAIAVVILAVAALFTDFLGLRTFIQKLGATLAEIFFTTAGTLIASFRTALASGKGIFNTLKEFIKWALVKAVNFGIEKINDLIDAWNSVAGRLGLPTISNIEEMAYSFDNVKEAARGMGEDVQQIMFDWAEGTQGIFDATEKTHKEIEGAKGEWGLPGLGTFDSPFGGGGSSPEQMPGSGMGGTNNTINSTMNVDGSIVGNEDFEARLQERDDMLLEEMERVRRQSR